MIKNFIPLQRAVQFDGSNIQDVVNALNTGEVANPFEVVTSSSYRDYDAVFETYGQERFLNEGDWVQMTPVFFEFGHIPDIDLNDPTKFLVIEESAP